MFGIPFSSLELDIVIGPLFVWIIFALTVFFFLLVSVSLRHHWKKFSLKRDVFVTVSRIYYSAAGILILTSVISFFIYTTSVPQ